MSKRNQVLGNYLVASSKKAHAINRLYERYGEIDFNRLSNYILKSRRFDILESDEQGTICLTNFEGCNIYFVLHDRFRGEEIATFLTKEMALDAAEEKTTRRIRLEEEDGRI